MYYSYLVPVNRTERYPASEVSEIEVDEHLIRDN